MSTLTFEVEFDGEVPKITGGMEFMGGKVVMVEFGPALTEPDWAENKGEYHDR